MRNAVKFVMEDGKIATGFPLTDAQSLQRDHLVLHFHKTVCSGVPHYSFKYPLCERLALDYITGAMAEVANTQQVAEREETVTE